jgi:parallel beta-helix repeat protein
VGLVSAPLIIYDVDTTSDTNLTACTSALNDCSLRGAINNANGTTAADVVHFAIPGTGPFTINLTSALPVINYPITIDGASQTGAHCNTLSVGNDANLLIVLTTNVSGINGLVLGAEATASTIKGLVINHFNGPPGGSAILGFSGSHHIECNFIGVNAAGAGGPAVANYGYAVGLQSSANWVGGPAPGQRNVLSGSSDGVYLGDAINNTVQGNYIGTGGAGITSVPNRRSGIYIGSSSISAANIVGGTTVNERNVIAGNSGRGIWLTNSTHGNTVQGNYIGINANGTPLANVGSGVEITGSTDNIIGGAIGSACPPTCNQIASNSGDGISVTNNASTGNFIRGNSIHDNGGLGINLIGNASFDLNDLDDPDTGPNSLQNYPILDNTSTTLAAHGMLNSSTNSTFTLQFYYSLSADPTGYGEGATPDGSTTVTTVGNNVTFSYNLPNPVPSGYCITATATDSAGNTSEFSPCQVVLAATPPCVPPPAGLVAWYPMDETSGTSMLEQTGVYNGAYYNNPTINSGYVLNSRRFNGSTQYGEAPTGPNFGTGDFTIDAWINTTSTAAVQNLVDKRQISGVNVVGYALYIANGYVSIQIGDGTAINYAMTGAANLVNNGQWHFVAATVHRVQAENTYVVKLTRDNVTQTFTDNPHFLSVNNSAPLRMGRNSSGSPYYNGSLDEVELFNRALDQTELASIYTAGMSGKCKCFAPPADMVGWYPLDESSGTTAEDVVFGNNGTYNNNPIVNSGYVLNSRKFNGINQYVQAPDSPALNFGTGNFSIDAWIRIPVTATGIMNIVDKRMSGLFIGYSLYTNGGLLVLQVADGTVSNYTMSSPTLLDGNWHFVAATVTRSPYLVKLFVDNNMLSFTDNPRPLSLTNTSPLLIGRNSFDLLYFTGDIDEVELFSRALKPEEMRGIFNAGSAGKCKPTAGCPALLGNTPNTQAGDSTQAGDNPEIGCDYLYCESFSTLTSGVTDIGNQCDDCLTDVTLPFPYTLYNVTYSKIKVSSNGFIRFDNGLYNGCCPNGDIPQLPKIGPAIFAYHADLITGTTWDFQSCPGCGVFTRVTGVPGVRNFYIEWRARYFAHNGPIQSANFEIVLHENERTFDIIYAEAEQGGSIATIGVQSSFSFFTKYSYNTPNSVTKGRKVHFWLPCETKNVQFMLKSTQDALTPDVVTSTGNNCDDCVTSITLPFPYTKDSVPYTNVKVSSNGALILALPGPGNSWTNQPLPLGAGTIAFYPHWDDLRTDGACASGPCGIYTRTSGPTGARVFTIQWRARLFISPAQQVQFEIRLYENQGRVDFVYGTVSGSGNSATVGMESKGLFFPWYQYSFNTPSLATSLLLSYTPLFKSEEDPQTQAPGEPSSPSGAVQTFEDVPPSNTFFTYVSCAANAGVIGGYPCGGPAEPCVEPENRPYYRPYANVTRGQLSKIVASMGSVPKFPAEAGKETFADVPSTDTFSAFIEELVRRNVIGGYECGGPGEPCDSQNRPYFRPGANATRGQISKIVSNAAGLDTIIPEGKQTFADVPREHPFSDFIERLYLQGAVNGYDCGGPEEPCDDLNRSYFRSGSSTTRGQLAKIAVSSFMPECTVEP